MRHFFRVTVAAQGDPLHADRREQLLVFLDVDLDQIGSIVNQGRITVGKGKTIRLLGGTVFNTGTLSAPEGEVTLLSVVGHQTATFGSAGEISLGTNSVGEALLSVPTLPELLQQQKIDQATELSVDEHGTVRLRGETVPTVVRLVCSGGPL